MLKHSLDKIAKLEKANRWIYETIEPYLGNRILDAGCGCGTITNFFLDRQSVVVIDNDEFHLEELKRRYSSKFHNFKLFHVDLIYLNELKFNNKFDTIVCLNTLEHIKDDDKVLDNFNSVLEVGGRLILSIPALSFLFNQIDITLGHIRRYEKKELVKKLTKHGFDIERIFYFNLFGLLGWFITGNVLKKRELPVTALSIFDILVPIFRKVEVLFKIPIGSSLFAICKKI